MDKFSQQSEPGKKQDAGTPFTEQHIGRYFWVKYKGKRVKLQLARLTSAEGWFDLPGGRRSVACSNLRPLSDPDGPPISELSSEQIGQTFWVYQQAKRGQFQLLGLTAERGWFDLPSQQLSLHSSMTIPYTEDEDSMEEESEIDEEWAAQAAEIEKQSSTFGQEQANYKQVIALALGEALAKLQRAITGLESSKNDPDVAFLSPLKQLLTFMQKREQALEEGAFICLPNQDGPDPYEVASAVGKFIQLYRPFFVALMTSSQKADFLIHESVHSCLGVTDYAYKWQHIFRFLPLTIRLKNPDSYVAIARKFSGEPIDTPRSSDERSDYTLGMIQHICFRGAQLLKRYPGDPAIAQALKTIRPTYNEEQLGALVTLGTSLHLSDVVGTISRGKFHLISIEPIPTKLDEAKAEVTTEKTINVSYIASTQVRPYVAILARILRELKYEQWAIPVAKALDELTAQCLMPVVDEPTYS